MMLACPVRLTANAVEAHRHAAATNDGVNLNLRNVIAPHAMALLQLRKRDYPKSFLYANRAKCSFKPIFTSRNDRRDQILHGGYHDGAGNSQPGS